MSCEYFLFENKRDGKIITGKRLEPGEINVTVFAKNRGFPSLNNNASVTVNVVNKDHSLPVFSPQEVSTVLKKNKDRNDPVYIFSALGQNIIYRIVAGNDRGQFNLNEKTGELRTTKTFNYGMQPSYTITVEAERTPELQGPLPMNFAQLKIIVPDFHAGPLFEKQRYAARILNSVPSGFSVIRVTMIELEHV
ncbi:protocadherin-19-like [Mixophyes fleayi]|uniref:protocadherin-19-like n=1 Tax=Mixophyes fleayi TaxID=3061075 RepID=UPI003F4E2638